MLSDADRVWNRAAMAAGIIREPAGDRSLSAMLLAHGMAMNGGVLHVYEVLTPAELSAAIEGYRYFGHEQAAELLERHREAGALMLADDIDDEQEAELEAIGLAADKEYARCIADDSALAEPFESHYQRHPEEYADLADET